MDSTPAFSLTGSEAQVAMRREQEASAVAYTGTWWTWDNAVLSGGSCTYANASGASVTTTIVGSGFALVAQTGPEFGRARIYVDGVAEDIDLYAPSTRYQQVVLRKTLPHGTHTVKVEWTGTKNPASSGTYIGIDAIDVITGAPAGSAPTQALSFDAANRVVGYTYDARGNVLEDGTHLYTWDPMNRLTEVKLASTGATIASYGYDADGMRQTATVGGVTTRFVVDAVSDEIVALLDSAGAVVTSFVRDAAGALVAMVRSGAVLTYLTNAHGDVTALVDAAGAVVARWTYDAWGSPTEYDAAGNQVATGTAGNPFLFAGYLYDAATGLYYLRARYYDPATGRFLSMDPEPGKTTDRLSQNPYIYCQNDPVNHTDRTGRRIDAFGGTKRPTAQQQVAANKIANAARKKRQQQAQAAAQKKAADDVRRLTAKNPGTRVRLSVSMPDSAPVYSGHKLNGTDQCHPRGTPLQRAAMAGVGLGLLATAAIVLRAAALRVVQVAASHMVTTKIGSWLLGLKGGKTAVDVVSRELTDGDDEAAVVGAYTRQMQRTVSEISEKVRSGEIPLSRAQEKAAQMLPRLRPMFEGWTIDKYSKLAIAENPLFKNVAITQPGAPGVDIYHKSFTYEVGGKAYPVQWDIMSYTSRQVIMHSYKYGPVIPLYTTPTQLIQ